LANGDEFVAIDAVVPAELFNTTAEVDRSVVSPIDGTFGKSSGLKMLCYKSYKTNPLICYLTYCK